MPDPNVLRSVTMTNLSVLGYRNHIKPYYYFFSIVIILFFKFINNYVNNINNNENNNNNNKKKFNFTLQIKTIVFFQ
jgi:hypothetical protein